MTFRKTIYYGALLTTLSVTGFSPLVAAATAPPIAPSPAAPQGLSLTQVKITGDEFIILQNNSTNDISDLSQFSLKSFNNVNPAASGTTSATQQLPVTSLGAGQRLLLSAAIRSTCGATIAGKLSLSLFDSGGFLEILQSTTPNQSAVIDSVSWSSGSGAVVSNVPSSSKDPQALYYRIANGASFAWQLADQDGSNNCQLNVTVMTAAGSTKLIVATTSLVTAVDSAPATIVIAGSDPEGDVVTPNLPASDNGLTIPEITELLPNPPGSGNDASDEFIELYNPNDTDFDLSGFKLQTGISSVHNYTFSTGAHLTAKSFTSFSSAMTGLSLSNAGGRAQLLDPSNAVLVTTSSYGTALDGQSWALANGRWYWSLTPTAGAANVITLPAPVPKPKVDSRTPTAKTVRSSDVSKSSKSLVGTATKKAKPVKTVAPKAVKKPKTTAKAIATTPTATVSARPVQAKVVALVAGLAVLYGAYEYRADLANGFYKLRSKLGLGGPDWRQIARRRNHRVD